MKKIIILVLLFIASIISFFFFKGGNTIDDYYEYINKKEIDKIDLKDKNEISTFTKAKDEVDKDVDKIVDELLKSNKNMSNFYNNLIDYDTRNKLGLTPIKSYINKINNSNNINELTRNAIDIETELGIPFFSNVSIQNDLKDTDTNIVYLEPITFEFSSPCAYYNETNYDAIEAYIKGAGVRTLKLYGYEKHEARSISNKINSMITDIFILSANAVSFETGEMVNIDSSCNRVAPSLYGPNHVIFLIGKNKIEKDLESAIKRIKNYVAPKNSKAHNYETPCAYTGLCSNCSSKDRICRATVIYHKRPKQTPTTIILVNEELGW